jgi:alpha-ketoglutarate-dependent taurine dioxygenase
MEALSTQVRARIRTTDFPVTVAFSEPLSLEEFAGFFRRHESELNRMLLESGAILFEETAIGSKEDFEYLMSRVAEEFMAYVDGNSPRTRLSGNVYTSTEYDPAARITLHNELSYSARWPSRLFFTCTVPALTGGETPLADCRRVLQAMNPALAAEIEAKGIVYIRNLHGGDGMGPSWQQTFETDSREQVEACCRSRSIKWEWAAGGRLKLIQPAKGIIHHPVTGEKVWFNQIDQFHPSHLDPEVYETLMMLYGNEEDLPTFVRYGDGTAIPVAAVQHILATTESVAVARPWRRGDLLLLDNVLVAHGRRPFTGPRRVLVSMAK